MNHPKTRNQPSFPPLFCSDISVSLYIYIYIPSILNNLMSISDMARATIDGFSEGESFKRFFQCWVIEQDQHLQLLFSASESYKQNPSQHNEREAALNRLITTVISHYEHYYDAKSRSTEEDVLSMLSPSWKTTLEVSLLWIGGWRPCMAFHLLYSKSGIQLEAALAEVVRGLGTGDLGDLLPWQMEEADALQRVTIQEERELTEKMAKQQETVANTPMVELSHAVTEMMREEGGGGPGIEDQDRVEREIGRKERGLGDIVQIADDLRMRTLKGVIEILTPIQGVHFLIAAAELHLRLHDWGKARDLARPNQEEPQPINPLAVGS